MRNGPVLWEEILRVARNYGDSPVIAGGAVRDYVILQQAPKDIDVFLQGDGPADPEIDGWTYRDAEINRFPEYHERGGIQCIREYQTELCDHPIQMIWVDGDPVQYVKGFDLGTSQCYYRGAVVLGKNFLHDWHHQEISILPQAYARADRGERSRVRARALQAKYPNGAAIVEHEPEPNNGPALLNVDIEARDNGAPFEQQLRHWAVVRGQAQAMHNMQDQAARENNLVGGFRFQDIIFGLNGRE